MTEISSKGEEILFTFAVIFNSFILPLFLPAAILFLALISTE